MFVSTVIEMGIGLAVVYYVVGLIVSFITTQISIAFDMRGRDLYKVLDGALSGKLGSIMKKQVVESLKPMKTSWMPRMVRGIREAVNLPTNVVYDTLSSSTLSFALLDGVNAEKKGGLTAETVNEDIASKLPKSHHIPQLTGLNIEAVNEIVAAAGGLDKVDGYKQVLQKNIETWLDNVMLSGSSLYKENIRKVVIAVSLVVTVALNVDTIVIGTYFWQEPVARQLAFIEADKVLEASKDENGNIVIPDNYQGSIRTLQELKIPILWDGKSPIEYLKPVVKSGGLGLKLLGWVITWAAVTQGSSFWYDTLKKLKSYSTKPEGTEAKG
jgi:hypothetical protein